VAERILVLPGDGIGPEVTAEARRVLEDVARRFELELAFEEGLIGGVSLDAVATPLADEVVDRARKSRAVLLGAVGGPAWDGLPVERRPEKGLPRLFWLC
jgi:3-isopropylmalate dehydrogenase